MKRFIWGWIATFGVASIGVAQVAPNEISGIVKARENKKEVELVGANVYWLGTQEGTITDGTGKFTVPVNRSTRKLVVSYIGYKADTLAVSGNQFVEVMLEPEELNEVTVAGRKPGTHMSRVDPMTSVKITGEELCKAACCNLGESFETNASVDVSYSDAATGAKQIQMLGLSGNYVQMMTENMPNFRGLATPYGLGYIAGPWMESIQVSKGTASVLNGYEGLTGQINVEYKKPMNSEKFYLNLFGSSAGRAESNVNGSIRLNEKWSTAILAHYSEDLMSMDENNDGFRDEPVLKQANFINRWNYDNQNGFTSQFGIKVLDENRLGGQMDFEGEKPSAKLYGINIDTRRYEGFAKAGYVFDDDFTSLAMVASYSYHDQNSFYGLKRYDAKQSSVYANLIFQSYLGGVNSKFSTGASFQSDNFDEDLMLNFSDQGSLVNYKRDEVVPGVFFQYTYSIPEKLTLIAGIRSDFHNNFGTFVTPRLHVKYNLSENWILRASAGKGYRTPNVLAENSFLLASSRSINIADNIDQEEAWNYGANITRYIHINGRELTLNAEYYRTDFINQLIVDADQSTDAVYFYNLNGDSYANNFQVEAKYELIKGLDMVAAWRINDVKMTINDELVDRPLRSRYKGLLNFSYTTPLKKWQFDFTTQFNGKGRVPSTVMNPQEYQRPEEFDPYQIMNGQITKYFRTWELYVGVENLANFTQSDPIIAGDDPFGQYFDSSLIWGPVMGRKIYFGLRFAIDRE